MDKKSTADQQQQEDYARGGGDEAVFQYRQQPSASPCQPSPRQPAPQQPSPHHHLLGIGVPSALINDPSVGLPEAFRDGSGADPYQSQANENLERRERVGPTALILEKQNLQRQHRQLLEKKRQQHEREQEREQRRRQQQEQELMQQEQQLLQQLHHNHNHNHHHHSDNYDNKSESSFKSLNEGSVTSSLESGQGAPKSLPTTDNFTLKEMSALMSPVDEEIASEEDKKLFSFGLGLLAVSRKDWSSLSGHKFAGMSVSFGWIKTPNRSFKDINNRMGSFATATVDTSPENAMKWLWDFEQVERTVMSKQTDKSREIVEKMSDISMFVYRAIKFPRPFSPRDWVGRWCYCKLKDKSYLFVGSSEDHPFIPERRDCVRSIGMNAVRITPVPGHNKCRVECFIYIDRRR